MARYGRRYRPRRSYARRPILRRRRLGGMRMRRRRGYGYRPRRRGTRLRTQRMVIGRRL